jgi:hypothetical protein
MREHAAVTKRIAAIAAGTLLAVAPVCAVAQTKLTPNSLFEGSVTTTLKDASQPGRVSVQSWEIPSRNGATQDIPLTGFYVAHLLSGRIAATIAGQTTAHEPGSYWTVNAGATMQVKVLSELAVLETIVVAKQ